MNRGVCGEGLSRGHPGARRSVERLRRTAQGLIATPPGRGCRVNRRRDRSLAPRRPAAASRPVTAPAGRSRGDRSGIARRGGGARPPRRRGGRPEGRGPRRCPDLARRGRSIVRGGASRPGPPARPRPVPPRWPRAGVRAGRRSLRMFARRGRSIRGRWPRQAPGRRLAPRGVACTVASPASTFPKTANPLPVTCPDQGRVCGPVWAATRPPAVAMTTWRQSKPGSAVASRARTGCGSAASRSAATPIGPRAGLANAWVESAATPRSMNGQ